MNYYIGAWWHRGDQLVAMWRCYLSPGCFDSHLQLISFRSRSLEGNICLLIVISWSANPLVVMLVLWGGVASCWKSKIVTSITFCQQMEAWSALKSRSSWVALDQPPPKPEPQNIRGPWTFTLDLKHLGVYASPRLVHTLRHSFPMKFPIFNFQMKYKI